MSRRQWARGGAALAVGVIVCYFYPLFHVRSTGDSPADRADAPAGGPEPVDAADYVRDYWDGPLRQGEGAVEVARLLAAIDADVSRARSDYGRQAGLGGPWHYCVRGEGTVESIENERCIVKMSVDERRLCIELGVIVDNTVRDAIGVNVNDFANSQDFNTVSAELNRRVEQDVIKPNRPQLQPGAVIAFVGCAKITVKSDLDPFCIVPIRVEVLDRGPSS